MQKILMTVLSSTLLLAACGRTTTPPPVTAQKAGALYQVDVSISNDHAASASIRPASTPNIGAQNLINAPEPVDIDFKSLTTSTFVAKQNGVDTRHIHTTMKVTNNTAQTIRNLTFLPVVRSDADSDPSNNTQTPTVAGTPFLNVRLYDGSDANAQATSMKLTQAKEVSLKTGEVSLNTDASPYLTGLDVGQLTAAVPSDMKATVMDSGWVTGNTLAPGASTYVTFAVDIPVDRVNPKTQPFSFSMLITSAQDVTGTGVGASVDPAQVQGALKNWTFGAGESLRSISTSSASPALVSSIGADGTVDGTLPTSPTTYPFIDGDCTFQTTGSAPNFGYNTASLRAYSADEDFLGRVREYTPDGKAIYRIFSDTALRLQGTYKCTYDDLPTAIDFDLKRGWNITTETSTATNYEWKSASPDTRSVLTFVPVTEAVDVTFTDQSTLNLRAGQSVQRDIKLAQTGGISGDVTLETDVPGITVSPSTVTLPSFSAQSTKGVSATGVIKAQSLSPKLTFTASEDAKAYNGPLNLIVKKGGGEVGRGTLYGFSITVPSIYGYIYSNEYSPTPLPQGETISVPVTVYGSSGFSGATTITFKDLPSGITASNESVTLTDGSSSSVNIKVTASTTANLGTIKLMLTGPKYRSSGFSETAYLKVIPQRALIGPYNGYGYSQDTAPAQQGAWVLVKDGSGTFKLSRIQNNAVVQQETLETSGLSSVYGSVLRPTPDGRVVVVLNGTTTGSNTVYKVTQYSSLGLQTSYTLTALSSTDYVSSGAADASGGFWFTDNNASQLNAQLKRLDLTTGNISTFTGAQGGILAMSPDGATLMVYSTGPVPHSITRVNTASQSVVSSAPLSREYAGVASLTATNTGTAYYLDSYGSANIVRIAPDGQVTPLGVSGDASVFDTLYGVDRANPNVLWVRSNDIYTVDLTTLRVTRKDSQDIRGGTVELGGGLTELVAGTGSTYPNLYASHLTP